MTWNINSIRRLVFVSLAMMCCFSVYPNPGNAIKVLILSGKNNHEWQKTTPLLVGMYEEAGCFSTRVTELPDTLNYKELKKYDVVVSNWNSWPDNDFRMTARWEKDFLQYVTEGGGVVSIHAGASSFYSWKEYHQIGIGRWGKETHHGEQTRGKVSDIDQEHPITRGLGDFYIEDEIWEKPDIFPDSRVLASVSGTDEKDGHLIREPSVFVNLLGNGRSFFTTLGHNERALLNSGLRIILLRAAQWAAGREVTLEAPAGLNETVSSSYKSLVWSQSDTSIMLLNSSGPIWQYNFNNRFGKPYFHPVMAGNSPLTCVSPPDHPWHLGLWFSWKYINGVNYWEYLNDFKSRKSGYKSEGITEIQKISIDKNPDFSAGIRMELVYHPAEGGKVMAETRNILVSPPSSDGSYFIDFENIFKSLVDEVILDRTPIEGEPGGKSWGGYAGWSVRVNQDYTSPEIIAPSDQDNHRKNDWIYMGFNTLTGEKAGLSIMQHPLYTTSSSSWYVINNPEIPFFYFSPAILFDRKIVLKQPEVLHLKYRIWILPGTVQKEDLQARFDQYIQK
jgi:type 1 glutamine amidotransferase